MVLSRVWALVFELCINTFTDKMLGPEHCLSWLTKAQTVAKWQKNVTSWTKLEVATICKLKSITDTEIIHNIYDFFL